MMEEMTFVMIKPDGVQRGLCGQIISRFEARGLTLAGLKLKLPSKELAAQHYEHLVICSQDEIYQGPCNLKRLLSQGTGQIELLKI